MRVRGVGHACLEIEVGGLRIVTDPWWAGPAYSNQWYPWPTPMPDGLEKRKIDYLYLSHGHEDHLHPDTLKRLRPGAVALVPECLTGGMAGFLRELGFAEVIVLEHGRRTALRNGVAATCYVNLTDSLLVLEGDGQVLVNGNDALHASPPAVIEHFCRELKDRHPKLDMLFLGCGGASWFPTCIRVPGRNDREVARARERQFGENFLTIVQHLEPRIACPFAASFVLLEPHNRWINEVKLEVETPDRVHARRGPDRTLCHLLLPGDVIDEVGVHPGGGLRPTRALLEAAYADELREGCARVESLTPLTDAELAVLTRAVDRRLRENCSRLGRSDSTFELRLRDNPGQAIRVWLSRTEPRAELAPAGELSLALELRAEILRSALESEYGTEAMVIGYGATVYLNSPQQYRHVLALLSALSPRQAGWRAVTRQAAIMPLSTLGSLWRQRWALAAHLGTKLGLVRHPEPTVNAA
ncbi:MAG: MBL fold metallo-hydrolase [Myxococcaceae bacterium]